MPRITNAATEPEGYGKGVEISSEMIDAGECEILGEVGGAEGLGGYFSARELACAVYRAMELVHLSKQVQHSGQTG